MPVGVLFILFGGAVAVILPLALFLFRNLFEGTYGSRMDWRFRTAISVVWIVIGSAFVVGGVYLLASDQSEL